MIKTSLDKKQISKETIELILELSGIERGSGDWHQYTLAKNLITGGFPLTPTEYDWRIKVVAEYLRV